MEMIPQEKSCLKKRVVTICLDHKCFIECQRHKLYNCFYINVGFEEFPPSPFMQNAYGFLVWCRYPILKVTLEEVKEIFFIGADILLYRNPWKEDLFQGVDSKGVANGVRYDFMFQKEGGGPDIGCEGQINVDVSYIRRSPQMKSYLQYFSSEEGRLLHGGCYYYDM